MEISFRQNLTFTKYNTDEKPEIQQTHSHLDGVIFSQPTVYKINNVSIFCWIESSKKCLRHNLYPSNYNCKLNRVWNIVEGSKSKIAGVILSQPTTFHSSKLFHLLGQRLPAKTQDPATLSLVPWIFLMPFSFVLKLQNSAKIL